MYQVEKTILFQTSTQEIFTIMPTQATQTDISDRDFLPCYKDISGTPTHEVENQELSAETVEEASQQQEVEWLPAATSFPPLIWSIRRSLNNIAGWLWAIAIIAQFAIVLIITNIVGPNFRANHPRWAMYVTTTQGSLDMEFVATVLNRLDPEDSMHRLPVHEVARATRTTLAIMVAVLCVVVSVVPVCFHVMKVNMFP